MRQVHVDLAPAMNETHTMTTYVGRKKGSDGWLKPQLLKYGGGLKGDRHGPLPNIGSSHKPTVLGCCSVLMAG